jgi:hypothetical protein
MDIETPAAPAKATTIDDIVVKYLALREKKADLKKAFTESTEAIDAMMARLESYFLGYMNTNGLTSLPTQAGTPYRAERTSVTVADKVSFMAWILAEPERIEQFLDVKANKTAVVAFKEEHQDIPPGLNYSAEFVVNVRKS